VQDEDPVASAWRCAGDELGIVVVAPAVVTVGGVAVHASALLPQFGDRNGMVVFSKWFDPSTWPAAHGDDLARLVENGYAFTHMDWDVYRGDWFIDALEDWGWTGDGPPPSWYEDHAADE